MSDFPDSLLIIICHLFLLSSVGPLSVSLLNRKAAMSAGRRYEAMCQVVGARPAPAVTWWKGTQQIRDNITTNVSFSLVKIRLRKITGPTSKFRIQRPYSTHSLSTVCKSKSETFLELSLQFCFPAASKKHPLLFDVFENYLKPDQRSWSAID